MLTLTLLLSPIGLAQAPAAPPAVAVAVGLPGIDELMALPDHPARIERLRAAASGSDRAAAGRAGDAITVLTALQRDGRTDPLVVRAFLEAGLSPSRAGRIGAIAAAEAGELPPMLSTVEAVPVAAPTLPTVDELLALRDVPARLARLRPVVGQGGDDAVRAIAAIAVLEDLGRDGRSDEAVVRGFLQAALSTDRPLRDAAVAAAEGGQLPPLFGGPLAPAAPMPAPLPAPAPVQAAPASAPDPAPAPAPAPVAAAPAPAPLERILEYRAKRLYKGSRTVSGAMVTGGARPSAMVWSAERWTVFRDADPLSAREFATMVDDRDGLYRLRRRNTTIAGIGVGIAIVGGGLLVGGAAAMPNDDGLGSGLLAAGASLVGVSWLPSLSNGIALQWADALYRPVAADRLIREHNAEVRKQLGLSDEDVRDIETLR